MYRTLKKDPDRACSFSLPCPECGAIVRAGPDLQVTARCEHVVRIWRVAADRRVRVEFKRALAGAGA